MRHFLALAIVLFPAVASAQIAPDAQTLLERTSAFYRDLSSGRFEGTLSTGRSGSGGDRTTPPHRFTLAFRRPAQARLEGSGPEDVIVMINGAATWEYLPQNHEFIRNSADWTLAGSQIGRYGRLLDGVSRARVLWQEDVQFEGRGTACDVVEVEYTDPPVGQPRAASFWITRERGLVVREVVLLNPARTPDASQVTVTTQWTSVEPNATLPDSLFVFSPAPDDKEVKEFTDPSVPSLTGSPAPALTIEEPGRDPVTLAELRGSIVLLLFWTTQCETCVRTAAILDTLQREFSDQRLVVIGAGPEPADRLRRFMTDRGMAMRLAADAGGALAREYHLEAIPTTFVIDREGTVRARVNGARPESDWRETLRGLGLGGR